MRWHYRLDSLLKAHRVLMRLHQIESPTEGERMGIIQAFEMSFELSWKLLGDYLTQAGYTINGPRPIIKQAFQNALISNGDLWLQMLTARNRTTHVYNDTIATEMIQAIQTQYIPCFTELTERFEALIQDERNS